MKVKRIRVRVYCANRRGAVELTDGLIALGHETNEEDSFRDDVLIDLDPTEGRTFGAMLETLAMDLEKSGVSYAD